ncbi:MAG: hypothetical protein ACM31C_17940 [Acidobacteriota bacterium]
MAPATPATSTTTQRDVVLTWKLAKTSKTALGVSYRIENKSKTRIYVADKQLVMMQDTRKFRGVKHVRVEAPQGASNVVRLLVAPPSGDVPSIATAQMTFIALDPGAVHTEDREVALPLPDAARKATTAVLVINAFTGEPPTWTSVDGEQGPIKVPEGFTPTDLVFGPVALP